jgi:hypothetical protein
MMASVFDENLREFYRMFAESDPRLQWAPASDDGIMLICRIDGLVYNDISGRIVKPFMDPDETWRKGNVEHALQQYCATLNVSYSNDCRGDVPFIRPFAEASVRRRGSSDSWRVYEEFGLHPGDRIMLMTAETFLFYMANLPDHKVWMNGNSR